MMRALIVGLVSAVLWSGAAAADSTGGLPAEGTVLQAHPSKTGYRVVLPVGTDGNYWNIAVTSSEGALDGNLSAHAGQTAATPLPSKKSAIRVLNIDIGMPLPPQGQYAATLVATPDGGPVVERGVQIHVPATAIEVPPSLVVEREVWGLGHVSVTANRLQLWQSDRGWLTALTLTQKNNLDGGAGLSGAVVFPGAQRVKPGDVAEFQYDPGAASGSFRLAGEFPLGVAHGNVVVRADQLAAPVTFPVEIRSRLTRTYLILILFLGLLLGWFIRRYLKAFQDLNQKREAALVLVRVIDAALATKQDTTFRDAALAARRQAWDAYGGSDPAAIQTATDAAQAAFNAAVADFDRRSTALKQQVAGIGALLGVPRRLPKPVADAVAAGVASVKTIAVLPDIDDAAAQLKQLVTGLSDKTIDAGKPLRANIDGLAGRTAPLKILAGEPAATAFIQALTAAAASMDSAVKNLAKGDPSSLDLLTAALQALHGCTVEVDEALRDLSAAIGTVADDWAARMRRRQQSDPQAWTDALAAVARVRERLATAAGDAENLPDDIASDLDAVLAAVKAAIANQASGNTAVAGALDAGNISGAIDALPAAAVAAVPAAEALKEPAASEIRLPLSGKVRFQMETLSGALATGADVPTPPSGPAIDALRAAVERNLAIAGRVQTAIYGAIILASGYFVFQAAWTGTPLDFAAAFAWAFVIDIGADSATTALQGLGRR